MPTPQENDQPLKSTIKLDPPPEHEGVGRVVGRYKILEMLGEGGCGLVYVAEQTEPVRRRVALKVIKLGMDTKAVVARFEAERQALAMMDHPNIAKVFDAGTTENGRPYFVMELVRGIRVTEYCDQNNLTTNERLGLFIKICQAIQHAHQKGIIHRDIKPSNILVTLHDGVPVPKVIDFGIAKATEGRLTDATVYTQLHQFIGTPAYMSPEQAEMSGLDVDTRADIYSLGVVLYELLTGRTPFDSDELMSQGIDAMRKAIRENEPARPSTRVATLKDEERTTTAKRRSVDPSRLLDQLQGDLDWIVMKCLEKDRTRRYETANGLGLDIQRHLSSQPVLARPPSAAYKFQKAVRRNKLVFFAAAAIVLALAAGLGLAAMGLRQAVQQRNSALAARADAERAEEAARGEAAKQQAINDFLKQMFAAADPEALTAPDIKKSASGSVLDMLDTAAKQLEDGALKDRPQIEASVRETLGETYQSRGQYFAADAQLLRALALEEKADGPQSPSVARTLDALARLRTSQDKLDEAEKYQTGELEIERKLHGGKESPELARALYNLADIHMEQAVVSPSVDQERGAAIETEFREVLAMQRRVLPPRDRNLARTLVTLGRLLSYREKPTESESVLNEALAMQQSLLGPDHPDVAFTLQQLAETMDLEHRFAEGERLCVQAIAIQRKTLGDDHPALATSLGQLGELFLAEGNAVAAEIPIREALAIRRNALGENNIHVAWCLRLLANCLAHQKKWPEAEQALRDQLPVWAKSRGVGSDGYLQAVQQLLAVLKTEGKTSEIETFLNQTLAEQLSQQSPAAAVTLNDLADFFTSQGRFGEAGEAYNKALEIYFAGSVKDWSEVPRMVSERAINFVQLHEFRDVELLYDRAINAARQQLPASDPILAQLVYESGEFYCYKELKWKEGADQMRRSLEISRPAEGWRLADHERSLGIALLDSFQFQEAERYCREVLALNPTINQEENFWVRAFPTITLAWALAEQQKLPEAERDFRDGLAIIATPAGSRGMESWVYPQVASAFLHVLRLENKTPDAAAFTILLASNRVCLYAAAWAIEWGDSLKEHNHPENLSSWSNDVEYLVRAAPLDDSIDLPPYLLRCLLASGYKEQALNICRRRLSNAAAADAQWLASTSFELANVENLASRDPALALEMAKRAVELSPRNPDNIWLLTAVLYRAGDFEQSLAEIEKAPRISQYGEAVADLFLAMAHCQIGQAHTARLLYEQSAQWIAEHDPDSTELSRIRTETESLVNSKTPVAQ